MAFCTNCGASVAGQFCTRCGAPAPGQPQGAGYAPPPAQPPPPAAPYTPAYAPPPSPNLQPGVEYATWATRVLGYLIDSIIVGAVVIVLFIVAMLFGGLAGISGAALRSEGLEALHGTACCCVFSLFPLAMLLVGLWNKVYLVAQRGASIGQGVVKIKVVNAQGGLLTMGQAALRLLVHIGLGFVPLGSIIDLLWPLWDERRQTLHDKAVGCYVVTNPTGA